MCDLDKCAIIITYNLHGDILSCEVLVHPWKPYVCKWMLWYVDECVLHQRRSIFDLKTQLLFIQPIYKWHPLLQSLTILSMAIHIFVLPLDV
jgi:hypothetical protein